AFIYDRKLDERKLALEYYRRYLGAEDAAPQIAARALRRVRELVTEQEAALAAQQKVVAVRRPSGISGMEIGGYVAGGVGLAALGLGVAFGVQALNTHDRFKLAPASTRAGFAATGREQALLADVFLGLGTASVVTGVVMLLLAPDEGEDEEVSWHPMGQVGPDGVSFGVGGRW
ncbi:MAG: hypothetical protein QF464_23770, partial [Myxococcota bacterium]|nr:hypothetical protein [Myxococcota bacterium]